MYPTSLTPRPSMIAFYVVAVYCMQVGYCILLTIARKQETKVRRSSDMLCSLRTDINILNSKLSYKGVDWLLCSRTGSLRSGR